MTTSKDSSQKEVLEEALRDSEEKFHEIFNNINDAIHIHKINPQGLPGKFIEVNNVACRMLQYGREELLSRSPLDFTTEYHSRPLEEIGNDLLTVGHSVFETEHRRKDGHIIPVEVNAHVVVIQGKRVVLSVVRDISERKKNQKALVESEQKFRRLADNAPDIIFRLPVPEGRFEYVNAAFKTITGYPPEELIASPSVLRDMIPAETEEWFSSQWNRILTGEPVPDFEYQIITKSGKKRWLHQRNVAVVDDNGKVGAIEGIITDITERKKSQEVRSRLAAIVESSHDAIIGKTLEGIIVDWNKGAERLYGYSGEEILGKSISLVLPPDRSEEIRELIRRIKNGEVIENHETERITKEGRRIHVALTISPILNESGEIIGASTIAHDITRRRGIEKALRDSEKLFHSLFNHMIEGHALHEMVYDTKGHPADYRILEVNPAFEKHLGIRRESVVGKLSCDAYGVSEPPYLDIYAGVAETGKSISFETYFDAMQKIFLISAYSPEKGQFATVFEDITDHKHVEDALKQANQKLQLMSSVTRHDILNKLTVLIAYLELEKDRGSPGSEEMQYLEKELEAAYAIQRQIEFTRYYQNIGVQTPAWQDVSTEVKEATAAMDLGRVKLVLDLPDMEIYADPMLRQVFYNLAENAVRHGETLNKVRFHSREEGSRLVIVCSDNGIGIPGDLKERIFDRTYYRHTGFGLYLSREILSITGITIKETGTHGKGARFEIHVPEGRYRHHKTETV